MPGDRCFIRAELSFAHATLKTVPLITCEEVGNPPLPCMSLSPFRLLSQFFLSLLPPPSLSGKWGWLDGGHSHFYSQSVWVHHSLIEKLGEEEGGGGGRKGKERNIGPRGERAGFKSRLQIYWKGFSQAGLHLTFSSDSFMDYQLLRLHHSSTHLPAANHRGFLKNADPKGFWTGVIQVTQKRGNLLAKYFTENTRNSVARFNPSHRNWRHSK